MTKAQKEAALEALATEKAAAAPVAVDDKPVEEQPVRAKRATSWTKYCAAYAAEHGIPYSKALTQAKESYHASKAKSKEEAAPKEEEA